MASSSSSSTDDDPVSIPKVASGVAGLDDVLFGGFPEGRVTLISGGPGSGKTLFALQFLYEGALNKEPGIFVSFEEKCDSIRRNTRVFGWDLQKLEKREQLCLLDPDVPVDVVQSGDFDIRGLLAILSGHINRVKARRLVIDASDVLLRLFSDPDRRDDQLRMLHSWLADQDVSVIITMKANKGNGTNHALEYMSDCVVQLDHRVMGQVATRRLRVLKYRGSGFTSNEHPYIITSSGIELMPVTNYHLLLGPLGPKFPTGVAGLDPLLDGGLRRGSCLVVGGASGTGKTTFAATLAAAACARGERVLYVTLEEGVDNVIDSMRNVGLDLRTHNESGNLKISSTMPESNGVEEHLSSFQYAFDALKPDHVIVDSVSACNRMGSEEAAFDFLIRLMMYCKTRGATCIYLNQTEAGKLVDDISGHGISSLADALIVLDQEWPENGHRRRLLILKVRGGRHSHEFHTFSITDEGLRVGGASRVMATEEEER